MSRRTAFPQPSSLFIFSFPVIPIGLASLPTAIAFSFLSFRFFIMDKALLRRISLPPTSLVL
jgi:hypothetical protein